MSTITFEYCQPEAVAAELKCSVCLQPWVEPRQTPCEHIYCDACITPILRQVQACPDCRQPVAMSSLKKPARALLSMVDRLAVYCPFKAAGCEWKGERGNAAEHVAKCDKAPAPAPAPVPSAPTSNELVLQAVSEFPAVKAGVPSSVMAMAHIVAPTLVENANQRKPVRVVACIDVSGSMSGQKLALVQQTLNFVIDELKDSDALGITAFNNSATAIMAPISMTADGRRHAHNAVAMLRAGGGTNIHSGLDASINMLRGQPQTQVPFRVSIAAPDLLPMRRSSCRQQMPTQHRMPVQIVKPQATMPQPVEPAPVDSSAINSVWLFTDGCTGGPCNTVPEMEAYLKGRTEEGGADFTTFTFAFGENHNAELLRCISSAAQGTYYYITDPSTIKPTFADCLGGLMSVVAQNIKLQIAPAPGVTVEKVLTKFPVSKIGNVTEVSMKDLYSEEQRDVLVTFAFPAQATAGTSAKVATWNVAYQDSISGLSLVKNVSTTVDVVDSMEGVAANGQVDEQRQRVEASEALEKARECALQGDVQRARELVSSRRKSLASRKPTSSYMSALDDELEEVECQMEKNSVRDFTNCMQQKAMCNWQQRANDASSNMYATSAKQCMRSKAR